MSIDWNRSSKFHRRRFREGHETPLSSVQLAHENASEAYQIISRKTSFQTTAYSRFISYCVTLCSQHVTAYFRTKFFCWMNGSSVIKVNIQLVMQQVVRERLSATDVSKRWPSPPVNDNFACVFIVGHPICPSNKEKQNKKPNSINFLIATGCEGVAGQNERANFQFQCLRRNRSAGRLTTIYQLRLPFARLLVGRSVLLHLVRFGEGEGASGCRLLCHLPLLCLVCARCERRTLWLFNNTIILAFSIIIVTHGPFRAKCFFFCCCCFSFDDGDACLPAVRCPKCVTISTSNDDGAPNMWIRVFTFICLCRIVVNCLPRRGRLCLSAGCWVC